jgi:hypothetical protein
MAIDTREERQTAQAFLLPCFVPGVDPGGATQPERQAAAWVYAGILAASATPGHPAARRLGGVVFASRVLGRRGMQVFRTRLPYPQALRGPLWPGIIRFLVQAGHSQRAVARVLGISHTSVWRVVHAAEAM